MGKSKSRTFCPHCCSIVPAGQTCPCRGKRKRKPTPGDATRMEREPWRGRYSRKAYRGARQEAIGRQVGRCADCGRICATYVGGKWETASLGGEVDHVLPLCEGGTDEPSNLRLRCKSCHGKVEAKRRALRASRQNPRSGATPF